MDKTEFKKLLFKVAFCTMACDGHIDKREIEELKLMDKNTTFFEAIDLSDELSELVNSLDKKGTKIIEELFESLSKIELNAIQELIILEVALRIINADEIHDENEVRFVNLLRGKLEVHDEIINDRFGKLDILHTNEYSRNITSKSLESFHLPDMSNIKEIDLKLD
ncbi:hypothetical protein [Plebeiibacterium marinum]|uniref:TerB family tellurite resistance protein n=1 Tax=Plebeiibacterium marinum TaxID=2992111 RepID=A0AAE3MDA6_9BACT|nr:hypothetical protein [Plebeiobacterium marinum]MCW3805678.1 hypothetical protein [Plebeiobacterium marinum]